MVRCSGESKSSMTWVDRTLNKMTLEEKVSQLFMVGFTGTEPTEAVLELIQRGIGGIIYFARNVESPGQLAALSRQLQEVATRSPVGLPLFIAIDQEGGIVSRLREVAGFLQMPGNMLLGATGDEGLVEKVASGTAGQLRAVGINMNFAPVVDVNNNPANPVIGVRSFGDDPAMVARLGAAAVRGYQGQGVLATAKHFPGHGDTEVDSHIDLPLISHSQERLKEVELPPFSAAVAAGVAAIMTAHVSFLAFEKGGQDDAVAAAVAVEATIPATLSEPVLQGLLRQEMGFDGLIVTDCMEMLAIVNGFGTEAAAVRAHQAGADLVLVSHTVALQRGAIDRAVTGAASGEIPLDRVDQAVRRVLETKQRFLVAADTETAGETEAGLQLGRELAQSVADRGITIVKGELGGFSDGGIQKPVLLVVPEFHPLGEVEDAEKNGGLTPLAQGLAARGLTVLERRYPLREPMGGWPEIADAMRDCGSVVACSADVFRHRQQADLIGVLLAARGSRPVVTASLRSPYDIIYYPEADLHLACYEETAVAQRALARVIIGEIQAKGTLPVAIRGGAG